MITQAELKELLNYNPATGIFVWKTRSAQHFKSVRAWNAWNTKYAGKTAGTASPHRRTAYRIIKIKAVRHSAHRLAWLYTYSEFPKNQIDHKDGDGLNNRLANLRDVTNQENAKNQRTHSDNTSGHTGVSFHKQSGRW